VVDVVALAAAHGLLDVAVATHESPVGLLALAWAEGGLLVCGYDDIDAVSDRVARTVSPRVLRAPSRLDSVRRALDAYFDAKARTVAVPVDLRLTSDFGRQVLAAAATLGYGTTASYGEIAAAIGQPGASRAVGTALGANPVCIVIPCHRVLRAGGELGGYAGGPAAKQWLLDLEQAGAG